MSNNPGTSQFTLGLAAFNSSMPNTSPFWQYTNPKDLTDRWNASLPYQLIVLREVDNKLLGYVGEEGMSNVSYIKEPFWTFTLPFPPESLSIQSPYAIVTTSTMGGIVEEHNGQVFKNITFSGTTGLYPLKGITESAFGTLAPSFQSIGGLYGGTASNTLSAPYTPKFIPKNLILPDVINPDFTGKWTTGFYQCKVLEQFLENYVQAKKSSENNDLRLAFAIWKDQAFYLCTPVQFVINRNAGSPLEYNYTLTLKAWKRINSIVGVNLGTVYDTTRRASEITSLAATSISNITQSLQAIKNNLEETTRKYMLDDLSNAQAINDVLNYAKQTLIKAKMDSGRSVSAGDLSSGAVKGMQKEVFQYIGSDKTTFDNTVKYINTNNTGSEANEKLKLLDTMKNTKNLSNLETLKNVFDPVKCPYMYSNVSISSLSLSPYQLKNINAEIANAQTLTKSDYIKFKKQVKDYSDYVAYCLGIGDVTYTETYNLPTFTQQREPIDQDYELLNTLSNLLDVYSALIINSQSSLQNSALNNTLDYVAGMASASGIAFTKPVSKRAVPWIYGYTLEKFANLYLKDPDRALEIITLNGLVEPYIDEDGFYLTLLANGSGNVVSVNDSSDLYVGQQVSIGSTGYVTSLRRITKLNKVDDNLTLVTLNGEDDLDNYKLSESAYIYSHLPNTVNCSMMIYIPSNTPSSGLFNDTINIPGIDTYDPVLRITGFDLLLNETNDLIVTSDGDNKWVVGYQNVIQTLRLMVSTPLGSLLRHPGYGFGVEIGTSVADFDIKNYYSSISNTILSDPMFASVPSIIAQLNGPVLKTKVAVKLKDYDNLIPVTLDIPV